VERILDVAAVVFADQGFEAATTEEIAERAEVSIGSLYQYFPDKMALFLALVDRCIERSRVVFGAVVTGDVADRPWRELIAFAVDGFVALKEADPAFRALIVNFHLYGAYVETDAALHREFVEQVARILAKQTRLSPKRRELVATMVVQTISAMLFLSMREEPAFGKQMIEETKVMLERYLEPFAGET